MNDDIYFSNNINSLREMLLDKMKFCYNITESTCSIKMKSKAKKTIILIQKYLSDIDNGHPLHIYDDYMSMIVFY